MSRSAGSFSITIFMCSMALAKFFSPSYVVAMNAFSR